MWQLINIMFFLYIVYSLDLFLENNCFIYKVKCKNLKAKFLKTDQNADRTL